MSKVVCNICPHYCRIEENHVGFCGARSNREGRISAVNYGLLTGISLDPVEKKPLYHFYPGSRILSVGSFGCNLRCAFCQNYEISMAKKEQVSTRYISPEAIVRMAKELLPKGNIGIAYTYNEPLVGYEYVYDCARLARKEGLKNVLVTNGYVNEEPFLALLDYLDALNIDLKTFNEKLYQNLRGNLEIVKHSIELAAKKTHVEVTTLIIPEYNDNKNEIRELSHWLAAIHPDIPLHLTRFFPFYKMKERKATDVGRIYELAGIARESLRYVYEGNC